MTTSDAAVRATVDKGALVQLIPPAHRRLAFEAPVPRRRLASTPTMLRLSFENKASAADGYIR
jgi:hypothetical protein